MEVLEKKCSGCWEHGCALSFFQFKTDEATIDLELI